MCDVLGVVGSCDGDICADGVVGVAVVGGGFGLNDMSNGHAVGSDQRCKCVSMSNLVFG